MKLKFVLIITLVLALGMSTADAREFTEGQVWSYKARKGEEASTLLVNKVESDPKFGAIFHISVSGVRVKNGRAPTGVTTELPHFPVSKQTLEASCLTLLREAPPNPSYAAGYAEWKRAFERGGAGIFTVPVSEIVELVETTVNK